MKSLVDQDRRIMIQFNPDDERIMAYPHECSVNLELRGILLGTFDNMHKAVQAQTTIVEQLQTQNYAIVPGYEPPMTTDDIIEALCETLPGVYDEED